MAPFKNVFKQCLLVMQDSVHLNLVRNVSRRFNAKSPVKSARVNDQWEAIEQKRIQSFIKNKQHMKVHQRDKTVEDVKDRLDDLYYKSSDYHERKYDQTWNDFAEKVSYKRKGMVYPKDEIPPTRRRTAEERPTTAQPWDSEAKQFIHQLDVRTPLSPISRKLAPAVSPPATRYPSNRFESHVTYDGKPHRYY